jgi:hypothetical protein
LQRKLSLFILLSFIAGLSLSQFGCSNENDTPDDGDVSVNFDINEPNMKKALGDDDGYALAIHYGSDIHGSLETCG